VRRIVLVSGTSNSDLAKSIAEHLDVPLVDPQIRKFANGEIHCQIERNIRGADVFVIQSLTNPVNDNVMELLIMLDALKRSSANSITAVVPHYAYARQDRKVSPRTPITAKLMADLMTTAGASRVMTVDLHAGQIQGFFNVPFDNILPTPVMLSFVKTLNLGEGFVCVSPDSGGVERVREYAKKLKCDIALIDKRRTGPNIAKAYRVVGEVKGKDLVIFDDMIDTAGTLVEAARVLKAEGCGRIICCATHGVLSNPALERIQNSEDLEQIIITDTVPLTEEGKKCKKITVLSMADLLSKAIHRTYNHDSVSSLFV
jgi:ribose-phosphate pyrophosphokinase